jgi:DNA adenine methylase
MSTFIEILQHTERPYLDRARAKPFVKWAGGKRAVVPDIAQRLPESIGTYWEPFVGGGAVFFALDSRIGSAQLSDVNAELALTYQVVKNEPAALIDLLSEHATQHSRTYYLRVRKRTGTPTAVEVAARFIYLNKTCFNGLYRVNKKGQFNVPMGRYKNPAICDADGIRAASEVLQKASVRIRDFANIAPSPGDFIYCDPPYDGTFAAYDANGFDDSHQRRLRDSSVQWHNEGASVMLSNADTPLIRTLYGQAPFTIHEITAPRSINCDGEGRESVGELLITTYDD